MGNSLVTAAPPPAHDLRQLVHLDHPALLYEAVLGRGKFLKSVRARFVPRDSAGGTGRLAPGESTIAVEGRVVVKVYLQRGDRSEQARHAASVKAQLGALTRLFNLRDQPSLLPYARWEESGRFDAAYLVRAHVAHNMYDRLNSRPFPGPTEKLWFIYQLLRAVAQAHAAGVRHGDIKVRAGKGGAGAATPYPACERARAGEGVSSFAAQRNRLEQSSGSPALQHLHSSPCVAAPA